MFGLPAPSGVIVLAVMGIGDLVISWERRKWSAILSWDRVAEACGWNSSPDTKGRVHDSDYVEAARLVFAKQEAWMPLVELSANRKGKDVPACKIRLKQELVSFFGRTLLNLELDIVRNDDPVTRHITKDR
jgi:hypothetical protein